MNSSLEDPLSSSIVSEKPNVKWEDVVGLEAAKAELQEAILPTRFPQMFRGNRQAKRAVLLYGPPGTGKSYLAKAAATEADLGLLSVRCSNVESTGEGEGLMKQLFTLAREKKPSIIFIDELDVLSGKLDGEDANSEHTGRMTTEFLVQMEANTNDGVFVLAATNRPWSLHPAVQRRFQKRLHRCVHVPLPDEEARSELFKVHLGDTASSWGNADDACRDLAQKTAGFSGRDISDLVQDALRTPVKKVHAATYFRKASKHTREWYTPCNNPFDIDALPMKWDEVPARQLKEPALTLAGLHDAVSKTKPSVGEEEVRKCNEWTRRYAMEGA
ncbi:P-loop containing nucleoside triphosphate hydrolase protein [Dactylonectria macrodidyma]|uniref:P-loop containing nucleoside triphosphate hydrolase protein n=1 Tax=Dactylonectria macrodidyma TaxID=307937 RepID=A0A9P9EXC8_9HYPO|nr:P-loop containing nucleoside triphosphate hydrolase protein [Dactylonectria macrodidyma]